MITITVLTILHISLIIALAAMLTGSMALMASNPIKTAKTETPVQREFVSKEGSEALRAVTFPGVQQTPAVPTEHNKALDEKFLKFYDTEEEKRDVSALLSKNYNRYGSYLGSAIIQQYIDLNIFLEFLDGNIEILKRFDHPPDIDELNYALDKYIEKNPNNLFGNNLLIYSLENRSYGKYLNNNNISDVQKYSNFIAAKTNTADAILFKNLIEMFGIYKGREDTDILNNLRILMDALNPIL